MSVRQRRWRDSKTGAMNSCWEINIDRRRLDDVAKPVRKKARIQTRREAEREEREIRQAIVDGTYDRKEVVEEKPPTLAEFSAEFIDNYAKVHNKPTEVASKEGNLRRYLLPVLGHLRLDEVKVRDVDRVKNFMMTRGLDPKTVNNALATLSRMLGYAEELELIERVPRIRHLPVPETEFDFLTFDEAERLLEAAKSREEWRGMIFFALKTGLRFGELSELRWGDVDLVTSRMRVRRSYARGNVTDRKNRTAYTLPLSPDTVAFLKSKRHLKGDLVFCKEDGGRHIHRRADVAIKTISKLAGLRPLGWHVLRHTFGSHLAMRGRSLLEIKELMGHKDIGSTLRYAHLMQEKKADAIAVLDEPVPAWVTEQGQNMEVKSGARN
ncbi:MAG: tyrosine-type recombinase/integrase [Myxococcota bacterium]|nr:tyrosine-type recombinase/integrase [Myxococcota bacterium]